MQMIQMIRLVVAMVLRYPVGVLHPGAPGRLRRFRPLRRLLRDLPSFKATEDYPDGIISVPEKRDDQMNRGSGVPFCISLRRYHEPAQEDRAKEGIGPQAPKTEEQFEAPGEGSERKNKIG